jgi:hypothetical protein
MVCEGCLGSFESIIYQKSNEKGPTDQASRTLKSYFRLAALIVTGENEER